MVKKECKTCGGEVVKNGRIYECLYCGNCWEDDPENDINSVERANAWASLREGDFEKAQNQFESMLGKSAEDYESWWGKALADAHITYVSDLNENKKVPTCNNITEEAFETSLSVKNAVKYAPNDIGQGYIDMAKKIDAIRKEWLEKARKEPPYDVFLSFKDSDKERGLDRTQDSYDAQDLYNALVAEGFKVFFSRISLRDKISEQYEPYIYNAIKTAKVMIVFGEKPEYFTSTWIKNEWTRFRTRIEKKEKHKNSLVVVYKDMDPSALSSSLSSRQCMNMADMTFLSDLVRHIKRVIEATKQNEGLEKIKIEHVVLEKKETKLELNSVNQKDVGISATETDISTLEQLGIVDSYLKAKSWDSANKLLADVIFDDPNSAEANWRQLLADTMSSDGTEFISKLDSIDTNQLNRIPKIIENANKQYASELLDLLYSSINKGVSDRKYCEVLNLIIKYAYPNRNSSIEKSINTAIEFGIYDAFIMLTDNYEYKNIQKYISFNLSYIRHNEKSTLRLVNRILAVDEYNLDALRYKVAYSTYAEEAICAFETILKYTDNQVVEIEKFLKNCNNKIELEITSNVLRYYEGDLSKLLDVLVNRAAKMLECRLYEEAETIYRLILSYDKTCAEAYWGVCCAVTRTRDGRNGAVLLSDIPEYSKYLTLVPEERRQECIKLENDNKLNYPKQVEMSQKFSTEILARIQTDIQKLDEQINILENAPTYHNEIAKCDKELADIEAKIKPVQDEKIEIENHCNELLAERKKLGLFAGKQKKEIYEKVQADKDKIAEKNKIIGELELQAADQKCKKERAYANLCVADCFNLSEDERDRKIRDLKSKRNQLLKEQNIVSRTMSQDERIFLSISKAQVGDYISFGNYKGNTGWLVLAKEQGKVLLISKYAIERRPYNAEDTNVTWKTCTLRKWLNETYVQSAFSSEEQAWILSTEIINNRNPKYDTYGGNTTTDKVFLLSIDEVNIYFPSDNARIATFAYRGKCGWWLRSPGDRSTNAACVVENGSVAYNGLYVDRDSTAVRPALWINLEP